MIMKDKPLVSLLVANYNNAKYIIDTLQSAVSQTYANIEIIVVDDASEDYSIQIIQEFIDNHREFRIELYKNYINFDLFPLGV